MDKKQINKCVRNFMPFGGGGLDVNGDLNNIGLLLTMKGINGFFLSLSNLMGDLVEIEKRDCSKKIRPIGEIFNQNKSDKATPHHRYDLVYQEVFDQFNKGSILNILEIGLGTNNTDTVSHMGRHGRVGASLFSYQEYFTNANIFGADVDSRILFNEGNIKTAYVDQLNIETFDKMHQDLGSPVLDVFIEDGLHSVTASLNSLNYGLDHVKKGGFVILEDLANVDEVWQSIATIVRRTRDVDSVRLINSGGLMLVIKV